ncbi:MAG TPA: GNAT family N-acetyltransferase [Opitutus sp.]|nr:GNAT family N-acetyltransferase [Opitutus sp.]
MATPAAPDDIAVTHNEAESRFETQVYGELAVCDYHLEGDRMIFTHTYVPTELRGRGVAQKLVRTALEFAREKNYKVVPQCSYVAVFIEREKSFKPLLA